jgi:hypothetical protein
MSRFRCTGLAKSGANGSAVRTALSTPGSLLPLPCLSLARMPARMSASPSLEVAREIKLTAQLLFKAPAAFCTGGFFVTRCGMEKQNRRKDGNMERVTRHLRHFTHEVFCHAVLNGKTERTERRKHGKSNKAPAAFCTGGFLSHCVKWKKQNRRKDGNMERGIKAPAVFCTGGFLSHCVKWNRTDGKTDTRKEQSRCLRCFAQEVICHTVLNGKTEQTERRKDGKAERRKDGKTETWKQQQGACGILHRRFFVTLRLMEKQNRRKRRKDGNMETATRHLRHFTQEVFCHTVSNGKTEQTERRKDGKTETWKQQSRHLRCFAQEVFCHTVSNRKTEQTERRKDGKTETWKQQSRHLRHFTQEVFSHTAFTTKKLLHAETTCVLAVAAP